jgi:hypothetical protein
MPSLFQNLPYDSNTGSRLLRTSSPTTVIVKRAAGHWNDRADGHWTETYTLKPNDWVTIDPTLFALNVVSSTGKRTDYGDWSGPTESNVSVSTNYGGGQPEYYTLTTTTRGLTTTPRGLTIRYEDPNDSGRNPLGADTTRKLTKSYTT